MHSRIIELGNAPILPDDRMGECSVPEWFYHSIADYTNAETDRDEDLKWFLEIVAHIVDVAEDGESFTFKPNSFGSGYKYSLSTPERNTEYCCRRSYTSQRFDQY